jgi:hypothetical protein
MFLFYFLFPVFLQQVSHTAPSMSKENTENVNDVSSTDSTDSDEILAQFGKIHESTYEEVGNSGEPLLVSIQNIK